MCKDKVCTSANMKQHAMDYTKELNTKELNERRLKIALTMSDIQNITIQFADLLEKITEGNIENGNDFNKMLIDLQTYAFLVKDVLQWSVKNTSSLDNIIKFYDSIMEKVLSNTAFNKVLAKFDKDSISFSEMQKESYQIQ